MSDATATPMFPLGNVLLPNAPLSLHVFEPRYRAMVHDVLADRGEFGVVLIARGHEVGGGDDRFQAGTLARLLDVHPFDDGRFALAAIGTTRFEVVEWLPDDPYPRAMVRERVDAPLAAGVAAERHAHLRALVEEVVAEITRRRPDWAGLSVEFPERLADAVWVVAQEFPVGAFDRQRLLDTDDIERRVAILDEWLDGTLLQLRAL